MILDFLSTIWPEDENLGELRLLKGSKARSEWCYAIEDAADWAPSFDGEGWDVYYGVLPRAREEGTAAACVDTTHVLWADVDAKRTGGQYAAMTGIRMLRQSPSIIVDSGHGYHAYWLLRGEVPFEQAQAAMRGLAREVQGDSVWDKPRILRVPGTTNRKDPENPVPVRLVFWDVERRYRISDFAAEYELPTQYSIVRGEIGDQRREGVPTWLTDLIVSGAPKGQRSETCFRAVIWMIRYGWTDDEIRQVFENTPNGIGEKYAERNNGPRWLDLTIRAAKRANQ